MKYNDIATQADYHAAAIQYVGTVYGEKVAQQFPGVADTVWSCVMMGMPEGLCWITVLGDHRLPLPDKEKNQ